MMEGLDFYTPIYFLFFCIDKIGDKKGASLVVIILERSDEFRPHV
jgi:hypothetical protein